MTADDQLAKILDERYQRMLDSGQEENMQQLFMERLQTTELDDAGWLCLLHQLLHVADTLPVSPAEEKPTGPTTYVLQIEFTDCSLDDAVNAGKAICQTAATVPGTKIKACPKGIRQAFTEQLKHTAPELEVSYLGAV